jgi:hypothetical protein
MSNPVDKIIWHHHEHAHIERSVDWYWSVGIVAIGSIILCLFFKQFLFALIIILFVVIVFQNSKRVPPLLKFEITRKGVRAGNTAYPYSMLESFWVEDTEFRDVLLLRTKKPFSPILVIPFDSTETNPEVMRDYLLDYLHEEELEEPLSHILMEKLGF